MKIRKIQLLTALAAAILASSCNTLDIEPVNILTGDQIYSTETGINAAIATLYARLPIAAQNASVYGLRGDSGMSFSIWNNPSILTGEAQNIPLRVGMAPKSLDGGMMAWWDYESIRYANLAIEGIIANEEKFNDKAKYDHWLGEAYFCRAYMYEYMVKCYGGVPIVKRAESYIGKGEEELLIPRNTEKEVVDFIGEDLDLAMSLMGPDELQVGRANRYIAANLKARVMLFAASEAKNGTLQLDGLVGIPATDATDYYKKAYEAAQFAVDNNGKYSLYRRYDDGTTEGKTENFWRLFVDETSANTERMFVKQYDASPGSSSRPENWSQEQRPHGFTSINESGELSATVEWIELFDDVDGNPFRLEIGTEADPVRYDNTLDLFAKAQPRLRGTLLLPGCEIPGTGGGIYEVRKGIYESYPGTLHESANHDDKFNGMTIQGNCGVGSTMTNGNGCVIWKYQHPDAVGQYWSGSVDWIEMRFAEVLLNKAEAAVNIIGETVGGRTVTMQDALEPINMLRERAGTTALTSVDEAKVINERRCELAFENRIFWDMKRWRMYGEILQNKTYHALYPYYVFDEGKYIFKKHERTELRYTFDTKAYYAPISNDHINRNPRLLPNNPGY